ncbi:2-phosphosulfolactate phosphatase [Wenyingzhuangia marina]|uniref:Probable 2-phosphosulfolactate phosphatase n=1 Tax=Wenyingzhuangia marina TaxID=1195760 RepID=A0A1M5SQH5_9FLAO|nr:2-phosphosulfolactate phosphatase [Wenyingzhuangia marina]GGF63477.1 putative 2-phosphosulfolactate phosphatase [Wenyingzhuangia marina]SHH40779.1 2-phosphosulfolactate phosphatase [Wenyingzhuangia marina]
MKNIEVVVAPELTSCYQAKGKLVVIIDVFRATTTIVTAMANGVKEVKTCLEVDEAIALKKQGYLVGGERDGVKVDGMDVDNSPLSFLDGKYADKKFAISTTNGTKAVETSLDANEIIIGTFANLTAVCEYIAQSDLDVLMVCAGWKGKMSTEDLMFAGAVIATLPEEYCSTDSADIAKSYFLKYALNYKDKLDTCEHAFRLKKLNKQENIDFCVEKDLYTIIPKYNAISKTFVL